MTAYDDERIRQTYILVFHEALYYGTNIDHNLINPTQLRHYSIEINNNSHDSSKTLGKDTSKELLIRMHTKGTKIRFDTRVPTTQELNECKKKT